MKFSLDTMNERERRMVMFGGIAAVVLLIFGMVLPLESSVTKAQERIGKKQADLKWMRRWVRSSRLPGPTVARPAIERVDAGRGGSRGA